MSFIPLILTAGSLFTLISGAPVPSTLSLQVRASDSYTIYGGNGETTSGWPSIDDWYSDFDTMFSANEALISGSCSSFGVADNTATETAAISSAIQSVASSSGVDARFILAIVMQESGGCVRAPTTNYGVVNPGLMQSHDGAGTCNDASVVNPCPTSEITQMITDGATGTSSGDGLEQCLTESKATDVSMYYKAARIYNSGSIDSSGNLGAGIATHCYSSDVANRLTGWVNAAKTCEEASIGSNDGTPTSGTTSSIEVSTPAATSTAEATTSTPAVEPTTTPAAATTTAAPSTTAVPTTTAISVPTTATASPTTVAPVHVHTASATLVIPTTVTTTAAAQSTTATAPAGPDYGVFPGAVASCSEHYTVASGDDCQAIEARFGITIDDLTSWNAGLDTACEHLWLGYEYCVAA